jgi:ribonucleoside-diphosphate reductase alpha chain
MMYVLMCGTGVGFSVERQYISKLPEVAEDFHDTDTIIHVADSKIGWAKAYRELISLLYSGQLPKWDVSGVRPAGATLKTFGGRASGAEPLVDLFKFTTEVFRASAGRKLSSIECHDICCKIAQIVVVGGVRRSALISLSNLTERSQTLRHF